MYGLLVVGRHKPRGLLVRLDRGDLNLLDQLYLVLAFFRSRKKTNNRIHNLRGQSQAPPPHRRNRKNPDSTSKVKHNVAPVTPPYNPPEREPKATPRKREKKQEPGKASTEKPPAVEKTADEMLDEELRKNTAPDFH